eukprot:Nk52_evm66s1810 gene=Nk52_evmTU66s1810
MPQKDIYVQAQQKRKAEAAESRKRRCELEVAAFGGPVSERKRSKREIRECQYVGCYTGHLCSEHMKKLGLDPAEHRLVLATKEFVNQIDRCSLKDESWKNIIRRVEEGELNVYVCSLHFEVKDLEFVNKKWGENNPICEAVMKSKSYWERHGRMDLAKKYKKHLRFKEGTRLHRDKSGYWKFYDDISNQRLQDSEILAEFERVAKQKAIIATEKEKVADECAHELVPDLTEPTSKLRRNFRREREDQSVHKYNQEQQRLFDQMMEEQQFKSLDAIVEMLRAPDVKFMDKKGNELIEILRYRGFVRIVKYADKTYGTEKYRVDIHPAGTRKLNKKEVHLFKFEASMRKSVSSKLEYMEFIPSEKFFYQTNNELEDNVVRGVDDLVNVLARVDTLYENGKKEYGPEETLDHCVDLLDTWMTGHIKKVGEMERGELNPVDPDEYARLTEEEKRQKRDQKNEKIRHIAAERKKIENADYMKELILLLGPSFRARRFSREIQARCYLVYSISPSAYRALWQGNMAVLPSPSTMERLSQTYTSNSVVGMTQQNLDYLKCRLAKLTNPKDKVVNLMLDEVYVKQCLEYSGGHIIGCTSNKSNELELAKTVLTFMIESPLGSFKDVVAMFPRSDLSTSSLVPILLKVLHQLFDIGFDVRLVTSDNHSVNASMIHQLIHGCEEQLQAAAKMKDNDGNIFTNPGNIRIEQEGDPDYRWGPERHFFNTYYKKHGIRFRNANYIRFPVTIDGKQVTKKVYFLLDPTHNFKNIYNNWTHHKYMFYPIEKKMWDPRQRKYVIRTQNGTAVADFKVIEHLYDREKYMQFKYAPQLTESCVRPTNILRCNHFEIRHRVPTCVRITYFLFLGSHIFFSIG